MGSHPELEIFEPVRGGEQGVMLKLLTKAHVLKWVCCIITQTLLLLLHSYPQCFTRDWWQSKGVGQAEHTCLVPTTKPLLTTRKLSGPFVQTAPWNLALGSLTWLWNIFYIWTPLYVPPKAFGVSRCWKTPKFPLKQAEFSAQVEDEISRDGWGIKISFIQDKLPKWQTKPISTTFKHNRQAHIGLWAVRPKTAPKSSPVSAQICSIWAQIHVEHWPLLFLHSQLYLYIRSISISGSSWCSFILTVSDRIIWRLNTKSWTCEKKLL